MDLMRKKPVAQDRRHEDLRRELGAFQLILLGIGCTVGAGIFVLTGTTAALHAGPGIVFSFILSGFGCLCAGLCYAEFASMIPEAGSAYSYAYATIGEFIAWIIGWDLILEYLFGAATVAVGWSGYVASFLSDIGLTLPPNLGNGPITFHDGRWLLTGAVLNVPALLIIAVLTIILILGIRESAWVNATIVFLKLAVIILFIIAGFPHVKPENWTPFVPPNAGQFGQFGWTGVLAAAGIIFYAYIGFDAVSTAAQETKKPERDMPVGILGSLIVCTVLYILVSLVLTGVVNYKELNVPAPVAFAVQQIGSSVAWIRPLIELGAIAGLSSVILVLLLGQPRIFYRMAADGLLPPIFAKIHPKFRTPYITTALTGLIAALLASLFPIEVFGALVSIGTLLAFVIVCVGVWVLRRTRPELPRGFRTPWVPLVPILGAFVCFGQMVFLSLETWLRLLVWLIIGLLIYFGYSRHHSRIHQVSPP
jgi:APA family basic amino acid/polyamine antiporter